MAQEIHCPTVMELKSARKKFLENEPRDLFYRAATELVNLLKKRKASLTLTESLAVLLQTWNKAYYQFRPFDTAHFKKIDWLVERFGRRLGGFRKRKIVGFGTKDREEIGDIFRAFERILGPVGASKALHLLAPGFFPLWDRTIGEAYGLYFGPSGTNSDLYINFMDICKEQCMKLSGKLSDREKMLKAIDEFNYCKYTKGWL